MPIDVFQSYWYVVLPLVSEKQGHKGQLVSTHKQSRLYKVPRSKSSGTTSGNALKMLHAGSCIPKPQ